jgi:arginase family enzyme
MSSHPRDAFVSPRFAQPPTFMRLPYRTDLVGVDVAIVGVPFEMLCVIAKRRGAMAE